MPGSRRLRVWLGAVVLWSGVAGPGALEARTPAFASADSARRAAEVLAFLEQQRGSALGSGRAACELTEAVFGSIWPAPHQVWLGVYHVKIDDIPLAGGVVRALWLAEGVVSLDTAGRDLFELCSRKPVPDEPDDPCLEGKICRPRLYWQATVLGEPRLVKEYRVFYRREGKRRARTFAVSPSKDPEDDGSPGTEDKRFDRLPWHARWIGVDDEEPVLDEKSLASSILSFSYGIPSVHGGRAAQECRFEIDSSQPTLCRFPDTAVPAGRVATLQAPDFNPDLGGWTLDPIGGARVWYGMCWARTFEDGRFCWPNGPKGPKDWSLRVHLESERFIIHSLEDALNPVEAALASGDPPVLVTQHDPLNELEVGTVAYFNLQNALDDFDRLLPLPTDEGHKIDVYQPIGVSGTDCKAGWLPGEIHLPLICRTAPLFEPKGLCKEVVAHEVAHHMMGRAVDLAENKSFLDVAERFLDEELADFFAMAFAGSHTIGAFCSEELRTLAKLDVSSPASGSQKSASEPVTVHDVTRPLFLLSRIDLGRTKSASRLQIPRLLLATILWGGVRSVASVDDFVDQLYSLIESMRLPDPLKGRIVEYLIEKLGCRRCRGVGYFSNSMEAIRRGRYVIVRGEFTDTPACKKFQYSTELGERVSEWSKPDESLRMKVDKEARAVIDVGPSGDVDTIRLRPKCDPEMASTPRSLAVVTNLESPEDLSSRVRPQSARAEVEVSATADPALVWRDARGRPLCQCR